MAENNNRLLYLISRAVSRLKYASIERFNNAGVTVTPSQMGILFLLMKRDNMSMSELSSILSIDNSTLTRLSDRLVKLDFIERVRDINDRRISKLRLTDNGRCEGMKAVKTAKEINSEISRGFTDEEMKIFIRVMESFFAKF